MERIESGTERRMHLRKPVLQGVLTHRTGLARWVGFASPTARRFQVLDISEGGIRFENHSHDKVFAPGERLAFDIQGHRVDPFRGDGRVTWTSMLRKGAVYYQVVGVAFASIPRRARAEVQRLPLNS